MEIALVARADTRAWLNSFAGQMRAHQPSRAARRSSVRGHVLKGLKLPAAVRKDISKDQASLRDVVVLREKISRALAEKLIVEFLDTVENNAQLEACALRIAFDFYGSGLLVWVETRSTESSHKARFDAIRDQLNKSYSEMGMSVSLAYFTEKDEMPFPPEYVPEAEVLLIDPKTRRPKRPG